MVLALRLFDSHGMGIAHLDDVGWQAYVRPTAPALVPPPPPSPDSGVTPVCQDRRRSRVPGRFVAAVFVAGLGGLASGCAEPATEPDGVDRISNRDSSTTSSVRSIPEVVIGGVEEPRSAHFLGRVGSVGRLRDGQILVVETTTNQVRTFDSAGEHRWTFGGTGDGPGEFRSPRLVGQASDDSVLVWDDRLARMTSLTPSGQLKELRAPGSLVEQIPPRPRAVLSNDMLVGSFPGEGAPDEFEDGEIVQDFSRIYLNDLDYSERTYVAEIPGATFQVLLTPDPEFTALPFSTSAAFTAVGSEVVAVGPTSRGVTVFSSEGDLIREMWVDREPRRVMARDIDRELERRLSDVPDEDRANEERRLRRLDIPEFMPVYDRVLGHEAGPIWARQYLPNFSDPRRWDRFTRDGEFIGTTETPQRLELRQVGPDWVLGIHYDDFMVPTVRLHGFDAAER